MADFVVFTAGKIFSCQCSKINRKDAKAQRKFRIGTFGLSAFAVGNCERSVGFKECLVIFVLTNRLYYFALVNATGLITLPHLKRFVRYYSGPGLTLFKWVATDGSHQLHECRMI